MVGYLFLYLTLQSQIRHGFRILIVPSQGSLEGNPSEYEGYFHWAFSVDSNRQWILIEYYVQMGPNASVLAWVTDSAGNEYTVPVTIICAGIQD